MKNKYAIEDQLYVLYENRIRLCIVNEIVKKPDSIWYKVLIDGEAEDDSNGIVLLSHEKYVHRSVDDLLKSLVEDFKMSMNFMDTDRKV